MKTTNILFLLATVCLIAFASCGGDDVDCSSLNVAVDLEQELDAINATAITYVNNPTKENCEAYKKAFEDYLAALQPYGDCAWNAEDEAEFNQALADAQESIDNFDCQ